MHEIVTLQFGQQSNYVGTHFWNTQESYFTYGSEESPIDHDIHFRPGVAPDGTDTYTPRTLVYDLKGAFGSLRQINALYEAQEQRDPTTNSLWSGSTIIQRAPTIPPSEYQQHLDAGLEPPPLTTQTVRYWSDYNRVYYHPRSLVQIHEYELHSQLMPFERWDAGEELFGNLDREHDLLDRDLRWWAEECDQLQALQIFTGVDDAWGGFAARYVERLRDEFGKMGVWVWGLEGPKAQTRDKQLLHLVNTARSIQELGAGASVYTPVSNSPSKAPAYVKMDPSSPWHTAALQSAGIESVTLPSRLRAENGVRQTLSDMEAGFNLHGNRRIAKLGLTVKDESHANGTTNGAGTHVDDVMDLDDGDDIDQELKRAIPDIDLFPETQAVGQRRSATREYIFGQAVTLRGDWPAENENADGDFRARTRARLTDGVNVERYRTGLTFPLLDSFPNILHVGQKSLSLQASLSTSSAVAARIGVIEEVVRRSVGIAEREALCNGLETIREEYVEGWDSASDEEDD